jgi:hypothetical protein
MAQELIDKIRAAAQAKGIDPETALRIARAESAVNPAAQAKTSSAGGLFQVVDKTWKEFGGAPGKKFDPDENIRVGTDIIAKNSQTLKAFLQRDPRPAEVYAAHYFGPSGAKSFLSAQPGTPMESLFSEQVIKANPNLKGKTSDQVMATLEKKMGGKPAAPVVSRETSAPVAREPLPPSLPPMAAAPAPADRMAALGPSYQAALALSFLADTDEKEDRDIDREPGVAEKYLAEMDAAPRPTALAGFSDISIKSPFAEPPKPQMLADGGEVGEESMASRMLKEVVPMDIRMLGSTLMGNKSPITESNFSKEELAAMQQAVDKASARSGKTEKGFVQYVDYPKGDEIGPGYQPVGQTLGRFVYEKGPNGQTVITDKYDFYNEGRKANVEKYEKMGRGEKALSVSGNMLKNLVTGNLRQVPGELADAYIGRDGRDVRIQLPVKRAGGGESEPTAEELEAASRPATVNPMIQRKGEAAKRLAAMRDVNTLPDPKTYAAVSGFLGQAPDEMGFSAMHPDREGIKKAGEAGFGLGTAAQIAPIGAALRGIGGKGTTTAAKMMEGMRDIPVGMSTKPVQSIFSPIPSADAPFVGRLDEFVSGLPGPVQKDQFLGMLKGKMRDYDIARAETTLADLPGNAKLTPVDLLNRIKTQYDPSQFKTTVVPPGQKISNYQSSDNPYQGVTGDGPPLGVIHLSQSADPKAAQIDEIRDMANNALIRLGSSSAFHLHSVMQLKTANDLLRAADSPILGLSESTASGMRTLGTQYRQIASQKKAIDKVLNDIFYPASDPNYGKKVNAYATEFENQGVSYVKSYHDAAVRFTKERFEENNSILRNNNLPTVPVPDFDSLKNPVLWAIEDTPRSEELKAQVLDLLNDAKKPLNETLETMKGTADELMGKFQTEIRRAPPYKGQHSALKNSPDDPISFSRFSEHTTDIPGIGKADGIYVNELQSDLLDDLRKKGLKGGSLEKDEKKLRELEGSMKGITNPTERKAVESKMRNLRTRLYEGMGPNNTPKAGFYELSESFPGMAGSPQVVQQLMVKNAVSGAMQMGKQFVAFPGAESAQAQLYEKLGPNLKSVVKDLGPGFELRDVTLRDPDGKQLMHKAIVWGPDAAARVQKKGVPFKDGGAVERQPADHRKYL